MSISTAKFVVQRGDVQYSCLASKIKDEIRPDDVLIVNRNGHDRSYTVQNIFEDIKDDDYLAVTDIDGVTYKISGKEFKDVLYVPLIEEQSPVISGTNIEFETITLANPGSVTGGLPPYAVTAVDWFRKDRDTGITEYIKPKEVSEAEFLVPEDMSLYPPDLKNYKTYFQYKKDSSIYYLFIVPNLRDGRNWQCIKFQYSDNGRLSILDRKSRDYQNWEINAPWREVWIPETNEVIIAASYVENEGNIREKTYTCWIDPDTLEPTKQQNGVYKGVKGKSNTLYYNTTGDPFAYQSYSNFSDSGRRGPFYYDSGTNDEYNRVAYNIDVDNNIRYTWYFNIPTGSGKRVYIKLTKEAVDDQFKVLPTGPKEVLYEDSWQQDTASNDDLIHNVSYTTRTSTLNQILAPNSNPIFKRGAAFFEWDTNTNSMTIHVPERTPIFNETAENEKWNLRFNRVSSATTTAATNSTGYTGRKIGNTIVSIAYTYDLDTNRISYNYGNWMNTEDVDYVPRGYLDTVNTHELMDHMNCWEDGSQPLMFVSCVRPAVVSTDAHYMTVGALLASGGSALNFEYILEPIDVGHDIYALVTHEDSYNNSLALKSNEIENIQLKQNMPSLYAIEPPKVTYDYDTHSVTVIPAVWNTDETGRDLEVNTITVQDSHYRNALAVVPKQFIDDGFTHEELVDLDPLQYVIDLKGPGTTVFNYYWAEYDSNLKYKLWPESNKGDGTGKVFYNGSDYSTTLIGFAFQRNRELTVVIEIQNDDTKEWRCPLYSVKTSYHPNVNCRFIYQDYYDYPQDLDTSLNVDFNHVIDPYSSTIVVKQTVKDSYSTSVSVSEPLKIDPRRMYEELGLPGYSKP